MFFPSYSQVIPTKFPNKIVTPSKSTLKVPSFSHEIPTKFPKVHSSPPPPEPLCKQKCLYPLSPPE